MTGLGSDQAAVRKHPVNELPHVEVRLITAPVLIAEAVDGKLRGDLRRLALGDIEVAVDGCVGQGAGPGDGDVVGNAVQIRASVAAALLMQGGAETIL